MLTAPTFTGAVQTEHRRDGTVSLCDDSCYPAKFPNRWAALACAADQLDALESLGYFPYPMQTGQVWLIGLAATRAEAEERAGPPAANRCPTCGCTPGVRGAH